jgi:hypothetical protein
VAHQHDRTVVVREQGGEVVLEGGVAARAPVRVGEAALDVDDDEGVGHGASLAAGGRRGQWPHRRVPLSSCH